MSYISTYINVRDKGVLLQISSLWNIEGVTGKIKSYILSSYVCSVDDANGYVIFWVEYSM